MDYLTADKNTLIWLCFTIYAVTALFVVPNSVKINAETMNFDTNHTRELQFAARLVLRLLLIIPMLALLTNMI